MKWSLKKEEVLESHLARYIFKKVGESVQKMFDYIPGKDAEEDIPLVTFKEEEFAEVEY